MSLPDPTLPLTRAAADSEALPSSRSPSLGVEFLTSLNHAIRTPMSGILGLSELMLETVTDPENREYLRSIRSCASTLNDLLSATLDYASHASGAVWLEEQDFMLSTAVDAGLRDARQRAEDNATCLEFELGDGLDRVVRSDALHLRDLIALVARVAIHSAANGGVHCRISLTPLGTHLGELTLEAWRKAKAESQPQELAEHGLQPSEELLGRSFHIETLETALVHHLVQLLRGSVRITTEPHAPILLRAVLPLALRDAGLQEERKDEELNKADLEKGKTGARPAVLIVDDNEISLRVLSSILSRAQFESVAVRSGQEAIDALAHRDFNLVLLDLAMPGMDGDVTTAHIRRMPNCTAIPVVGITAGVTEELRQRCRRNGMDAILGKPVDAEELIASVHFHLSRAASTASPNSLV